MSVTGARRVNVVRLRGRDGNNIRLRGTLPPILGELDALVVLDAPGYNDRSEEQDDAFLTGTIPAELGKPVQPPCAGAGGQRAHGGIPTELASLPELTELILSGNQLTGGIPAELGDLPKLANLAIENNPDLGGAIPPELGDIPTLTALILNRTGLTGGIPPELGA